MVSKRLVVSLSLIFVEEMVIIWRQVRGEKPGEGVAGEEGGGGRGKVEYLPV